MIRQIALAVGLGALLAGAGRLRDRSIAVAERGCARPGTPDGQTRR